MFWAFSSNFAPCSSVYNNELWQPVYALGRQECSVSWSVVLQVRNCARQSHNNHRRDPLLAQAPHTS